MMSTVEELEIHEDSEEQNYDLWVLSSSHRFSSPSTSASLFTNSSVNIKCFREWNMLLFSNSAVSRKCFREWNMLCHAYSNLLYLCLKAWHIRLSKRVLSYVLFPWDDQHAANETLDCSSTYSLTDCAVIDLATDSHEPTFSHFIWHPGGWGALGLFLAVNSSPGPRHPPTPHSVNLYW